MRFLNGNLKAQKIIFELKPRPLLARLRYISLLKGFLKSLGDFKEILIFPNLVVHK